MVLFALVTVEDFTGPALRLPVFRVGITVSSDSVIPTPNPPQGGFLGPEVPRTQLTGNLHAKCRPNLSTIIEHLNFKEQKDLSHTGPSGPDDC